MSETVQIIIGIILLVGVYILTQVAVGCASSAPRAGSCGTSTIKKPTTRPPPSNFPTPSGIFAASACGISAPRPSNALCKRHIVAQTPAGKYYLKKRLEELKLLNIGAAASGHPDRGRR